MRLSTAFAAAAVLTCLSSGALAGSADGAGPSIRPGTTGASKLTIATVSPTPDDPSMPAAESRHGDWTVRCDSTDGAKHCALSQSVSGTGSNSDIGLTVLLLHGAGSAGLLMRVLVPSGVLLPPGLGLRIDGDDIGSAPYVRCPGSGCISEVQVDPALLAKLSSGHSATFIIFQTPDGGIGIPISLTGLAEGMAALP